jgi:hypothetical protein
MTPDADRIGRYLEDAEVGAVREWCTRSRLPFASWPHHSALVGFVDLCVLRAIDEALQAGRARSGTAALRFVAGDFGLSFDALDRRFRRRRTRRKKADTVSATTAVTQPNFEP